MTTLSRNEDPGLIPEADALEMLRLADRADRALLAMVSCVALATLILAAASRFAG